jgi:arylsulfatase A
MVYTSKYSVIACFAVLALASALTPWLQASERSDSAVAEKPNIVVVFTDDMGYGDLGCFGHPTINTPNLDRMAIEGQRWTNFYVAAPICTPSRAALLTGRLPIRSGMCSNKRGVLFPDSAGGLPGHEITLAEALKTVGYATACVGKWHLGHLPRYLPTSNGFDSYFGIPYSNDMDRKLGTPYQETCKTGGIDMFNVPLMRDEKIIERPAQQTTITKRYTEEACRIIRVNQDRPFFLYLAHSMPHVPLFRSPEFEGKSARGLYGDVIEEIDWSVGQVLDTLRETGLAKRTLVLFTSDNGPWLTFDLHGGSAGLLRDGKGSTFEGGMREPTIVWWPGMIKPGVVTEIGSTLDVLATACNIAGAKVPSDRIMDSVDLSPVLFGSGPSPRDTMFYYRSRQLFAIRQGAFKAHFRTKATVGDRKEYEHDPPLLYNLEHDPSEKYDIAARHPDIIVSIMTLRREHESKMIEGEDQLAARIPPSK